MAIKQPLFEAGNVLATQGFSAIFASELDCISTVFALLRRHLYGDWGDLDDEDKDTNEESVTYGNRILSCYTVNDKRVWVITEADRSVTTFLLPEEY